MSQRLYYLDSVGAILLIHMILGHCCPWSQTYPDYLISTSWLNFFMPWFFFKAGMFFKERPIKEEIHKSYKRLIIPFIVFSIIGTIILWIKLITNLDFTIRSILSPVKSLLMTGGVLGNLPLWFLLSLFCVKVIFCFFYNKICTSFNSLVKAFWIITLGILCCSFLLVHYIFDLNNIFCPCYISNISSGLLFFTIGFTFKNYKPNLYVTVVLLFAYSILAYYLPVYVDMRSGELVEGMFLMWVPISVTGIITINGLAYFLINKPNILSITGAQTMPLYCLHWCIILIVSMFFTTISGTPNIDFLLTLIITNIIFLPVLTSLINDSRYSYIVK